MTKPGCATQERRTQILEALATRGPLSTGILAGIIHAHNGLVTKVCIMLAREGAIRRWTWYRKRQPWALAGWQGPLMEDAPRLIADGPKRVTDTGNQPGASRWVGVSRAELNALYR